MKIECMRGWAASAEALIVRRDFGALGCRVPGGLEVVLARVPGDVIFWGPGLVRVGIGCHESFGKLPQKSH